MNEGMLKSKLDDTKFLALFTLVLVATSLWVFSSYLHFILVAAVLALATSQVSNTLTTLMNDRWESKWLGRNRQLIATTLLTCSFLLMIFGPLLYFVAVTFDQINNLDLAQLKQTVLRMVDETIVFHPLDKTHVATIVDLQIKRLAQQLRQQGIELVVSKSRAL